MTLGSLRGRLRSLSVEQLVQVRAYEKAHADRLPVVTMLDNRIAKLATDASAAPSGARPRPRRSSRPRPRGGTRQPATTGAEDQPAVAGRPDQPAKPEPRAPRTAVPTRGPSALLECTAWPPPAPPSSRCRSAPSPGTSREWVGRLGKVWVEGQVTAGEQARRAPSSSPCATPWPTSACGSPARAASATPSSRRSPRAPGWSCTPSRTSTSPAARCRWSATRSGRSASASCWPGSSGSRACWRRRGCSRPSRKKPLPFLPGVVGLVTGRASAAERDVLENARRRWPAVRFDVREVAVQGHLAVEQVVGALRSLDARPRSTSSCWPAAAGASRTCCRSATRRSAGRSPPAARPVVSAIGHEPDTPAASTSSPTSAAPPRPTPASGSCPTSREELARVRRLRDRARRVVAGTVDRERAGLVAARSRPVLADPHVLVDRRADEVAALRDRARRCTGAAVGARRSATSSTPSPGSSRCQPAGDAAARLRRRAAGRRRGRARPADVALAERLRIRVAGGELRGDPHVGSSAVTEPTASPRTRRPATSWSRSSAGSRRGARPSRSRSRCGSAARRSAAVCQQWLDGAQARLDAALGDREQRGPGGRSGRERCSSSAQRRRLAHARRPPRCAPPDVRTSEVACSSPSSNCRQVCPATGSVPTSAPPGDLGEEAPAPPPTPAYSAYSSSGVT